MKNGRYELKETKDINSVEDVETRIYHCFKVLKTLPPVKAQGYINILTNMMSDSDCPDSPVEVRSRDKYVNADYSLMQEVCDVWWPLMKYIDFEDKQLIKFKCGAPYVAENKKIVRGWSRIRSWKEVAYEFHCHRNTAKSRWDKAMLIIFRHIVCEKLQKGGKKRP